MKAKHLINWKLFGLLFGAGMLAVLCVMPYALSLQADLVKQIALPLSAIVAVSMLQSAVLLAIAVFFGLLLGKRVSLGAPLLEAWLGHHPTKGKLKKVWPLSIGLGVLVGILINIFDRIFALSIDMSAIISPARWQGFLASFYGGIVEEILLRLFLMTLFVWLFSKITKKGAWPAIILSALLFGLGHLPATAAFTALTPLVITRAIILNGIGGVVFGWLYWKKGLESAIMAHFSADIMIHVVFGL